MQPFNTHIISEQNDNVRFSLWRGGALDEETHQTSKTQPKKHLHLLPIPSATYMCGRGS